MLLIVSLGLVFGASMIGYQRFFVERDYVVQYEFACDPSIEYCFVSECLDQEDAECETRYYSVGMKKASDLFTACGHSIEGCDSVTTCQSDDSYCEMSTCDPAIDSCAGPQE